MSVSIQCNVSLSKKLRGILKDVNSMSLIISDIDDGHGGGVLSFALEGAQYNEEAVVGLGETSIMITPIGIAEDVPQEYGAVGAIFSTKEFASGIAGSRDAVDKLAATSPPEREEVANAIVPKSEVETPEQFKEVDIPAYKRYISSIDDLLKAVTRAKSKPRQELDLSSAQNDRQRAIMIAEAEQSEGIGEDAWIVNDKVASLTINDLDLDLSMNSPVSLSSIPARKLGLSSDLRAMVNGGLAKFISPDEIAGYIGGDTASEKIPSLDIFDSADLAEANMAVTSPSESHASDEMELEGDDLEKPTAEESMILNLTDSMPLNKDATAQSGVVKSTHGSRPAGQSQRDQSVPRKSKASPIRKLD